MIHKVEDIYNYLKLSDLIATAGQPTAEQFSSLKKLGYELVINLALPESLNALANEKEIVETQNMQYVHIPVVWENPKLENFAQFQDVMQANSDKKVFVHCAANMRVSAFMYLYRRLYQGISDENAQKDLHQIWVPNKTWQQFIEQALENYQSR